MPNRAQDWLLQAERDLEQAEDSRKSGRHEWACFAAQQAAEKAVKALHHFWGQDPWGHVVAVLLDDLDSDIPEGLINKAKELDGYYIPPRYPNSHAAGPPFHHFSELQSDRAIAYAREIIHFARAQMAQAG